ncbi:MAG: dTDP-4-dehydrorhamnose reductase [Polyangiaceae bacterium]|nr:dTDP-4-dehydrorhamnose reductase [Myxococcales bacterium]MCB9584428.1 dTDP-4-dehydrorhamnose reductase [Polyangiaceae bacterium]
MAPDILLVGAGGGLGSALTATEWPEAVNLRALSRAALDVTDASAVDAAIGSAKVIINAAAYTLVDAAESQQEEAFAVNAEGPRVLARIAAARGIPLLHVSTDYVFDGEASAPYTEEAPTNPLGVYGASKALGEEHVRELAPNHLILRTSWVFGPHGNNFVRTMVRLMGERESLSVVSDQLGCPTPTTELARCIRDLAMRCLSADVPWGTFHLSGSPSTSWFDFAKAIAKAMQHHGAKAATVQPISTAEYPTAARRPKSSVLDCSKAKGNLGLEIGPWAPAMHELVHQLLTEAGKIEA